MTRARTPAVILLASSGIALPGCLPLGCGDVGGVNGLDVQLQFSGAPLPDDDYTIVVRADGLEATIDVTYRADGSGSETGPSELVDGSKHLELSVALGPTYGLVDVGYLEGAGPAQVEIEMSRGTQVLADQTFTPSYVVSYPNGESCPGTSDTAQAQLTVPL